jgi:hypothetical protein
MDAAWGIAAALERMLAADPTTQAGADAALTEWGVLSALLFTELKYHVLEVEPLWEPEVAERLASRLPPDEDDV